MSGFSSPEFDTELAARNKIAEIQAFFEANPEYWVLTHGRPPRVDEAERAFDFRPPDDMSYTDYRWFLVRDAVSRSIVGTLTEVIDLLAPGVHHLGYFMIETQRRDSGFAQRLFDAWQSYSVADGARWLRLGVVECNERGRRFWARNGFVNVNVRHDVVLGDLSHTLFVMIKPLGGTLDEYLECVPRDRPEATAA